MCKCSVIAVIKMPRFRGTGAWCLDIEIYLNILELIHSAAGGEGVEVLFRILSGHSEGSELVVNAQIPQSLIAACGVLPVWRYFADL